MLVGYVKEMKQSVCRSSFNQSEHCSLALSLTHWCRYLRSNNMTEKLSMDPCKKWCGPHNFKRLLRIKKQVGLGPSLVSCVYTGTGRTASMRLRSCACDQIIVTQAKIRLKTLDQTRVFFFSFLSLFFLFFFFFLLCFCFFLALGPLT